MSTATKAVFSGACPEKGGISSKIGKRISDEPKKPMFRLQAFGRSSSIIVDCWLSSLNGKNASGLFAGNVLAASLEKQK